LSIRKITDRTVGDNAETTKAEVNMGVHLSPECAKTRGRVDILDNGDRGERSALCDILVVA
jgi:hypothetical protein